MPMPRPMGPRPTVRPAPAKDAPDGSPTNVESGGSPREEDLYGSTISTRSVHTPSPPRRAEGPRVLQRRRSRSDLQRDGGGGGGGEGDGEGACLRPSLTSAPRGRTPPPPRSWATRVPSSRLRRRRPRQRQRPTALPATARPRSPSLFLGSGPSPFEATRQPSPPNAEDLRANPLTDKDGGLVVDRSSGELASSRGSSRSETPPSRQASSPPTSRSHTPTSSALFSVEEVEEKVWSQESAAAPTQPAVQDGGLDHAGAPRREPEAQP